jgi:aminoglycoside phosphotransferase (APT) family kinase protein
MNMNDLIGEGRTAEIIAWGDGKVLKLYKDWTDPSWAEREYASSVMAYEGGAPVPRPYELIKHDGRSGIVFERVEGRTALTLIRTQPWRLVEITRVMARMQGVYLKAPGTGLPSNKGGLEWGVRRVIEQGLDADKGQRILAALAALPDGDRLCHMDFHPDNVMLTKRGWVIIDWMNTRSGPPLSDVARTSLIFRVGEPPKDAPGAALLTLMVRTAIKSYNTAIKGLLGFTDADLDAWLLPVATARLWENIPGEREKILPMIDRLLSK